MLTPILSVTLLGLVLGLLLGYASRVFAVQGDALVEEVNAMMPGTNCGQCGFPGCAGAAAAIVHGEASPTCCTGGGKALFEAIAAKVGIALDLGALPDEGPRLAQVSEAICIGCCKCLKECPTDAIVGAAKQIHNVFHDACTGCGNCAERCPTGAISLQPAPRTLDNWNWPMPELA
jgi:Na+-translocating ferredoxin:NAD+ oxidoreductase subunit B